MLLNMYWCDAVVFCGFVVASYYHFGPEGPTVAAALAGVAISYLVYRMTFGTMTKESAEGLKYNRQFMNRARRVQDFPPPYPNTWYYVQASADLKKGEVKSLQLVGQEMVMFRNHEGKVSILHAFCPHLGAHLGKGGKVNKDGLLVCPFHEWKFDTDGKCKDIPYCTKDISGYSTIHQYAFPVQEYMGMIFMWFHQDREPPRFEVGIHVIQEPCRPCDKLIRQGRSTIFKMHMMEPSLNTQDWYHFGTTHQYYPGFTGLKTFHTIRDVDWRNDGTFSFFEDMETSLFGGKKARVDGLMNKIKFFGPAIACIVSQYGDMSNTTYATFTPIEPFKTKVDFTSFTTDGWGGFWKYASLLTAYTSEFTVKQDLTTWEHKGNPVPKTLVPGDRAGFNQYRKWLEQFYTESSKEQRTLEW